MNIIKEVNEAKRKINDGDKFFEVVMELAEESELSYQQLNNYLEYSIRQLRTHQGHLKVKKQGE